MKDWSDYKVRHDFYRSMEWQNMRIYILYRDKTCRKCSTEERPVMAEEVDHIIDIADRPDLRLDPNNLQGLCKSCHSKKSFNEHTKGKWEKTINATIAKKKWDISLNSMKCSLGKNWNTLKDI